MFPNELAPVYCCVLVIGIVNVDGQVAVERRERDTKGGGETLVEGKRRREWGRRKRGERGRRGEGESRKAVGRDGREEREGVRRR